MEEGVTILPDEEAARYWLALLRAPGVGSRGIQQLLDQVAQPSELFTRASGARNTLDLKPRLRAYLNNPDWEGVEQDLAWLAQPGNHLISLQDPQYPPLLRDLPDAPPVLFVHGNPDVLQFPQLAIVGSRNPSVAGKQTAQAFAGCLASAGLAITSGLAIGIDAAAHAGALQADGITLAVTGTGLDRVYPAQHRELAHQIAQQGALVSEFPPGTPARVGHFPRRNRIISGLSVGTLVVEAALHSGSLITARQAAEQGREVFAIPGSIHNPLARGCHALIRQGAKLVETAQDIMEELASLIGALQPQPATDTQARAAAMALDQDYRYLLDNIGYDPVPVDLIVQRCGLSVEVISSMLLLLELEGYVLSAPGGRYYRTDKT